MTETNELLKACTEQYHVPCTLEMVEKDGEQITRAIPSQKVSTPNVAALCESPTLTVYARHSLRFGIFIPILASLIFFIVLWRMWSDIDPSDIGASIGYTWLLTAFGIGLLLIWGIYAIIYAIMFAIMKKRHQAKCTDHPENYTQVPQQSRNEKIASAITRALIK